MKFWYFDGLYCTSKATRPPTFLYQILDVKTLPVGDIVYLVCVSLIHNEMYRANTIPNVNNVTNSAIFVQFDFVSMSEFLYHELQGVLFAAGFLVFDPNDIC